MMACIEFPNITDITNPFPSTADIIPSFTLAFTIPQPTFPELGIPWPPTLLLPALPTLPTLPAFDAQMPSISSPSAESVMAAGGVFTAQLLAVVDSTVAALVSFVPALPWPTIPGLPDFDLPALLAGDPDGLFAAIKVPNFDMAALIDPLSDMLPPMWPDMDMPDQAFVQTIQVAVNNYFTLLIGTVTGLLDTFLALLDDLELPYPALPALPTLPTMTELVAMLPEAPSLDDLFNISVPGFPSFTLPTPLIPDTDKPQFNLTFGFERMFGEMQQSIIKTIADYILTLPLIDAVLILPTLADVLGALPAIPMVCSDDIPEMVV